MMYKVGITGLMGSGKTTVCQIFETLGIPVFYADNEAKNLMENNQELKLSLLEVLGRSAYLENGQLNREYIAQKIFHDTNLLAQVNALVHPVVLAKLADWFKNQASKPYALYESALLTQKHLSFLDFVILVSAPQTKRLNRLMHRQNSSREDLLKRMATQPNEKTIKTLANFVIYNNGQALIPQVLAIHKKLIPGLSSRQEKG